MKQNRVRLTSIGAAAAVIIISLLGILPAFGAGEVAFIDPSAIGAANDGTLTVARPDPQIYGRQGSEIGLFLIDDELKGAVGLVKVRSEAYRTPTALELPETSDGSGEFALRIKTVPYGAASGEYTSPFFDSTGTFSLPVDTRDLVWLASDDSSARLYIETMPPRFTGLYPAHNYTGRYFRPEVTGQVTDDDSGLDEKNIHILFMIEQASGATYSTLTPHWDGEVDEIAGGFNVAGRLRGVDAPSTDAKISWWITATDEAGNVGYSDREPTKRVGASEVDDSCAAKTNATGLPLDGDALIKALAADSACDPYVTFVDNTRPELLRAETGRHWDPSLFTGDSDDKTEYRAGKAEPSSLLVVFDAHLDATSVSASDFEVYGSPPVDVAVYNVKVRQDGRTAGGKYDGNSEIAGDSVLDAGLDRGYVFLTLPNDLKADAAPRVELVGEVADLGGNEQDSGRVEDALDRIAPTVVVTIDEGVRPATNNKVNLTISTDERVRTPKVTFHKVTSANVGGETAPTATISGNGTVDYFSASQFAAEVNAANSGDGLYTIRVEATDIAGGNMGYAGDIGGDGDGVDVSGDTNAILFEYDGSTPELDVNPDRPGVQDTFSTEDPPRTHTSA